MLAEVTGSRTVKAYLLASDVEVRQLTELLEVYLEIGKVDAFVNVLDVAAALWTLLLLLCGSLARL